MINGSNHYLLAILSKLGLSEKSGSFEDKKVFNAMRWAAGGHDFSSVKNQIVGLQPVLATLNNGQSKHWFQPRPLTLSDDFFPTLEVSPSPDDVQKQIAALKKAVDTANGDLLTILHYHGSSLAVCKELSDLPLYDFVKTAAAILHCLEKGNGKLRLMGGSISGVQTFLYDIVSKNAAKNLKGRSFYMHLLADSAVFSLLKKLDLPRANVLYASGGSFFVLAPSTDATEAALNNWVKETLEWFFKTHKMRLFLETGSLEVETASLLSGGLPRVFNDLQTQLRNDKKHPFAKQLLENFEDLFEPHGDGGDVKRDAITGDELSQGEEFVLFETAPDGTESFISKTTQDIRELGNELRRANFWVTSHQKLKTSGLIQIEQAGVWQTLFESHPTETLPEGSIVRLFNKFDFTSSSTPLGVEFYGGNDQPYVDLKHSDEPKTFSELAGEPDKERKNKYQTDPPWQLLEFKRFGVLRMDVDGLGKIFENGLPTLAHYSALSRSLDWFFKGHLNHIWENGSVSNDGSDPEFFKYNKWTQILYAGGDDLFLVGRWDCLLDFAFKIRQAFHHYTCENKSIGLSGGVSLVTHKYPIMKAADQAGASEKKAKRHQKEGHFKKNSFTLLGVPLHWPTEFEIVQSLKERLVEARQMREKPMPQSILMKIAAFHEQRALQEKLGEPPSWRWRIAYDLTRARERARGNPQVATLLDELTVSIFTGRYNFESDQEKSARVHEFFDLLMVSIRWAELELRHRRALKKLENHS
ncbi:MAG: type III-A CRISPR-associated protein Cas10/Csm1 [Saprospiraceae bacterium]|nr:type III-A CRISPR-associated protein Cas10/Csm1 [Saprospiraceae bacterium]